MERNDDPSGEQTSLPDPGQPSSLPTASVPGQAPTAPVNQPTSSVDTGFPWQRAFGVGAGILLGLAVLSAPGVIRWRRRQLRLGYGFSDPAERIEAGWAEVRDTARDLRKDWPTSSPRSIATAVGRWTDAQTQQALIKLSGLVEVERYGRTFTDSAAAAQVPALVATIRQGLLADRSRAAKLATAIFPRSILKPRS
jgi:hypothetical protein